MPFVEDAHRKSPDLKIPGDRCYVHYEKMMRRWEENPKWRTIDALAERLYPNDDDRAYFLAFMVHFVFHGVPYEEDRREENGEC